MNNNSIFTLSETILTRNSKFGILLILEPPSLLCNFIFVFYLIIDHNLRVAIHHHVILALLIVSLLTNLIEIPRILHYLRIGIVTPQTTMSCLMWQWCDYLLYGQANVLMLWASFERHILVFHSRFVSTTRGRLFIHYLPLFLIIIYLILFYTIVILIYPCKRNFDFELPLCGQPCFTDYSILSLYDLFIHSWLPTFFIAILSVSLVVRVINRKRTLLQQDIPWRKHRRMILQLLSISCLYLICMGPYTLIQVIDLLVGLPDGAEYIKNVYFFYVYWLLTLLLPYTCIGCLPEVRHTGNKISYKHFGTYDSCFIPSDTMSLKKIQGFTIYPNRDISETPKKCPEDFLLC
ncbi:unnamed protein product [Adineta steineri]|uniref:G-protein coupled receptors family 1 profile domain-containing protein n=1 Tax=Adineta steineri TaxID=433720 RepID=A0A819A977_9BILA|nr:unnamed protein product [Adineta steineri]